jgi:hypothetical protein
MKIPAFVIIALGVTPVCYFAQDQQPQPRIMQTHPRDIEDWSWIKQPWTGDSSPYVRLQQKIKSEFDGNMRIEAITQKYKELAQQHPKDPLAQYAWGYAAYSVRPPGYRINAEEIPDIALALSRCPYPKTYQYAHLLFVTTIRWRPYSQLKPMGYRLLARDKHDHDVKRGMIDILVVGTPSEEKLALEYAQQVIADYPALASSYASLGWVYETRFLLRKEAALGDKAISCYRKAQALSKSPTGRRNIERNIRQIQQEQRRHKEQQKMTAPPEKATFTGRATVREP